MGRAWKCRRRPPPPDNCGLAAKKTGLRPGFFCVVHVADLLQVQELFLTAVDGRNAEIAGANLGRLATLRDAAESESAYSACQRFRTGAGWVQWQDGVRRSNGR
jgi:hypothetical protein